MNEAEGATDYYELLKVSSHAQPEQIRASFLRLAKQHHPDVGGSTKYMQQLTEAYRTLISTSRRKTYDMLHNIEGGHTYREHGAAQGGSETDMDDDAIDDFLNAVYAEFQAAKPQSKPSWLTKIKQFLG